MGSLVSTLFWGRQSSNGGGTSGKCDLDGKKIAILVEKLVEVSKLIKTYHRMQLKYFLKLLEDKKTLKNKAYSMTADMEYLRGKYDLMQGDILHKKHQAKRGPAEDNTIQEGDIEEGTEQSDDLAGCHKKEADEHEGKECAEEIHGKDGDDKEKRGPAKDVTVQEDDGGGNTEECDDQEGYHEEDADECKSKQYAEEIHGKDGDDQEQVIKESDHRQGRLTTSIFDIKEQKGIDDQKHGDAPSNLLQLFPILEKIHLMFLEDLLVFKGLRNRLSNDTEKVHIILMEILLIVQKLKIEKFDVTDISWVLCSLLMSVCYINREESVCLKNVSLIISDILSQLSPLPVDFYDISDSDSDYDNEIEIKFGSDSDSETDSDSDSDSYFHFDFNSDSHLKSKSNKNIFSEFNFTAVEIMRTKLFSYMERYEELIHALDIRLPLNKRETHKRSEV